MNKKKESLKDDDDKEIYYDPNIVQVSESGQIIPPPALACPAYTNPTIIKFINPLTESKVQPKEFLTECYQRQLEKFKPSLEPEQCSLVSYHSDTVLDTQPPVMVYRIEQSQAGTQYSMKSGSKSTLQSQTMSVDEPRIIPTATVQNRIASELEFDPTRPTITLPINEYYYMHKATALLIAVILILIILMLCFLTYYITAFGGKSHKHTSTSTTQIRTVLSDQNPQTQSIIDVRKYHLYLVPNFGSFNQFTGFIIIEIHLNKTDKIVMHSANLKYYKFQLICYDSKLEKFTIYQCTYNLDRESEMIDISLNNPLENDAQCNLTANFSGWISTGGNLRHDGNSVFNFFHRDNTNMSGGLLTTIVQPEITRAHTIFPCFNEPSFKSKLVVRIGILASSKVLGNTRLDGRADDEPKHLKISQYYKWLYLTPTPVTSIYTLFMAIFNPNDFIEFVKRNDNITIKITARPQLEQMQIKCLQSLIEKIIRKFEQYFNTKYPFNKLDVFIVPVFMDTKHIGWMNSAILVLRESEIDCTSTDNLYKVSTHLCYSISQQWLGAWITMKWWDTWWLFNGFARFIKFHIADEIYKEFQFKQYVVVDLMQPLMWLNQWRDTSIRFDLKFVTLRNVMKIFTDNLSNKGAIIYQMLENCLGETEFRNYILMFIENCQIDDCSTTFKELFSNYSAISRDLYDWMNKDGFPLVTVKRSYDTNTTVILEQERFCIQSSIHNKIYWSIPINWIIKNDKLTQFKITEPYIWFPKQKTLHLKQITIKSNEWILFNKNQLSYYRVNYDERNWAMLIQQLYSDHRKIDILNRCQLIDDSMNIAYASKLSYFVPFELLLYLQNENDYLPWLTAFKHFNFLRQLIYNDESITFLNDYVNSLLIKHYNFNQNGDSNLTFEADIIKWACIYNYKQCLNDTKQLFVSSQNSTLKRTVLCTVLKHSDTNTEATYLWRLLNTTNQRSVRANIIYALGCNWQRLAITKLLYELFLRHEIKFDYTDDEILLALDAIVEYNPDLLIHVEDFIETNLLNTISDQFLINLLEKMYSFAYRMLDYRNLQHWEKILEKRNVIDNIQQRIKQLQIQVKQNQYLRKMILNDAIPVMKNVYLMQQLRKLNDQL